MSKVDAGLRALFHEYLPRFDFVAIESGLTSRGIPDTNFCFRGIEGWIEMKATSHWRVEVRAEQVGWIERRIDHGGRVFTAVRRAQSELWLFHGSAIRSLLHQRLDALVPLGMWRGSPAAWDWTFIAKLLIRKH